MEIQVRYKNNNGHGEWEDINKVKAVNILCSAYSEKLIPITAMLKKGTVKTAFAEYKIKED